MFAYIKKNILLLWKSKFKNASRFLLKRNYALDQLKKGKQQTQLARDLGISESTLRGWKTDEGKLRSLPKILEEETGLQRKRVKLANDNVLDSALYQWGAITARCIERCWINGLGPAFTPSTQNDSDNEPEFT